MGIAVVIADQMEAPEGLLADAFSLPFISVARALPVNRKCAVPSAVMPCSCTANKRALELNKTSTRIYDWLMKPHARITARYSKIFGSPFKSTLADCFSPFAQLSQTTPDFDSPRTSLSAHFCHVGPLRVNVKIDRRLNYPVSPIRPFFFASVKTLHGGRFGLFKRIARACKAVQVQLLTVHCNHLSTRRERLLSKAGVTWVTGYANQHAAVQMTDVVVIHGGLNTDSDVQAMGTPLLALPIAFDQPGVVVRVVYEKVDLTSSPRWATETFIATALSRLINATSFADTAARLGQSLALAGGACKASCIVLAAIAGCPVLITAAPDRTSLHFSESPVHAA